jgi:hypothetical protein
MVTRAMATAWAMATAMRLASNKKAGEGCKGNGDGNVKVAGDKEGKSSKAMATAMATRMAGEWSATAMKRLMAMVTRVAGKQQQWQ